MSRPPIAVNEPIWVNLTHDPRLTTVHDPAYGEVRVVGDYSYVLAEAVS